jgi:hypothetical protein
MKKISIEVPEALDRQVRVLAAQLDLNRSEFARLALQERVELLTGGSLAAVPKDISSEREDQDADAAGTPPRGG